ncbi:hypothetical protein B4168_0923 [Anoxybacillus flavithermus]|nr:hypothetical protein B4168_0923 [Anoxybacillus flavithermus]OAO86930.1 hypothetical protein GT23_1948 [Parageobacillus thermoglucosidasius]
MRIMLSCMCIRTQKGMNLVLVHAFLLPFFVIGLCSCFFQNALSLKSV